MTASRIPKELLQIDAQLQRLSEAERAEYLQYLTLVGFEPSDPNYPAFTLTFISYCLTRRLHQELMRLPEQLAAQQTTIEALLNDELTVEVKTLTRAADHMSREVTRATTALKTAGALTTRADLTESINHRSEPPAAANEPKRFWQGCVLGAVVSVLFLVTLLVVLLTAGLPASLDHPSDAHPSEMDEDPDVSTEIF